MSEKDAQPAMAEIGLESPPHLTDRDRGRVAGIRGFRLEKQMRALGLEPKTYGLKD